MTVKDLKSYQILNEKYVKELNSEGILLEHKKTGARVFLLSNDDENKVFCIGFRTPPDNDCGLPHILEHSVLCGSDKFPLKDPFVELVKGSLNTFLNAMTYPDKTVYPVASCNDKDFHNLMDVYMDAVLHPNIYKEEKIFRQEGWHYELESKDAPLIYNGVVYNEMKGAYSSPESILDSVTQKTLFPDTCYGKDSGGDPVHIPELSYEKFLDFHRTYYHPSNSYIYLYGDMDMAEKLEMLDRDYLSRMPRTTTRPRLTVQDEQAGAKRNIPYYTEKPEPDEAQCALAWYTGAFSDRERQLGVEILLDALLGTNNSPLKAALLAEKLGADIDMGFDDSTLQPTLELVLRGATEESARKFAPAVRKAVDDMVYDLYGEENPRPLEDYVPRQGPEMGGQQM